MKNLLQFRVKAFALTVIFLIGISGVLFAQKIAIIDAGSSGSRLFVYNINADKKIELVYPKPEQEATATGGKLSELVSKDTTEIQAFLTSLTTNYTLEEPKQIPLYILATAGMRLETKVNAEKIYTQLRANASKISSKFELKGAMTISGQYEGLYAWIAANYKKGVLTFSDSKWNYNETAYGILEIGGASMQIAFATNTAAAADDDCIIHPKFGKIYSKSYLGGGVDQIFEANKTKQEPITFNGLENVSRLYPIGIQFLGIGKPIETVLDYTPAAAAALNKRDDRPDNYHPWITNYYIKQVIDTFKTGELTKLDVKSSWTEGAALDIVINGNPPENYYDKLN